jgi:cation diffusion facilitator CzcD-associated flavoprotein CzcO
MAPARIVPYDVFIIGAGLSGLASLYQIKKRFPSWTARVVESAPSVGGTWFWNCYPGARFDSESISYHLFCDKGLLQEWEWSEAFASQKEILRYVERFAEKNDLNSHIQFNTTVVSARWLDDEGVWLFVDAEDIEYRARFLICGLGLLSNPSVPKIPNIENFAGQAYHTSRFPKDFVLSRDLKGKRVGVIGTGSTGIQTSTAIAQEPSIESLTVFQRTAQWAAPLRNYKISKEQMQQYKDTYDAIQKQCLDSPQGFLYSPDPRKSLEVTDEERLALWEKLWEEPGFGKWMSVFSDTYTDHKANKLYSDWVAAKIRARVNDPVIADKLIPKNHGIGTRRLPLESGYFEIYNKPNVHLVDLKETPVETVSGKKIITSDGKEHELDVLIYATGFDAITGSFVRVDWTSKSGRPLIGASNTESGKRAIWLDHRPSTNMGILVHDMPNMFMILGPHQPYGNIPRSIEHSVQATMDILEHCNEHGYTRVESTKKACDKWGSHVIECGQGLLANEVDSWSTGVNTNSEGKSQRFIAKYSGSVPEYRRKCEDNKENSWPGVIFG